ncbi:MAG: type I-B CRISPR-associated protein Cas7/Cst2/DevR [Candidatus Aenigmatarchaeota archaeon]
MTKVVQISILGKISGNVNADEVIGTRITLKKMYSSGGEVLPFVSARAIKFAIRKALYEKGFKVDPLYVNPNAKRTRLSDSAKPHEYIDNDIFGYMRTLRGEEEGASLKRQAPIALSYFKALRDTPIKAEFAAKFPRPWGIQESPVPFEIEVAEYIGKINCIMYDYIGDFTLDRKIAESIKDNEEAKKFLKEVPQSITPQQRKERIKAFCEVFLTPTYVLPRATNSLNIPEYIAGLVVLSEKGPLPVFQYLNYDFEKNEIDIESLKRMMERKEVKENIKKIFLIDYKGKITNIPDGIKKVTSVDSVINEIVDFL